jgi:cytochrome c556
MYRKLIALTTALLVVALCWPFATAKAHEEEQGKSKVGKIMQEKLKHSQKLLEGIAIADYDKVSRSAEELILLSKTEEWHVIKTPKYEMHSNEFRRAAELVIQKAKAKNLDGVTLAYFELTMSCVRCHQYVREVRDARLELPGAGLAALRSPSAVHPRP